MKPWSEQERTTLAGRWRRTQDGKLRLVGSCPGKDPECGHNGAFDHVVVEKENVEGILVEDQTWPPSYGVSCRCRQHNEEGCGKTGDIPIPDEV